MYGLSQAGILANRLLKKRLTVHDYYEVAHTPGLFTHKTRPIWFTLTVDDFGVKYIGKEHAEHLMSVLKQHYDMEEDWKGELYSGIHLKWNYKEGYVDISMSPAGRVISRSHLEWASPGFDPRELEIYSLCLFFRRGQSRLSAKNTGRVPEGTFLHYH